MHECNDDHVWHNPIASYLLAYESEQLQEARLFHGAELSIRLYHEWMTFLYSQGVFFHHDEDRKHPIKPYW